MPSVYMAAAECVLLVGSVYLGYLLREQHFPESMQRLLPRAVTFAGAMLVSMLAMGVYSSRLREGFTGVMLRTAVAFFLLGVTGLSIIYYLIPSLLLGRGVLAISAVIGFVGVGALRTLVSRVFGDEPLKRRVLVIGTGRQAQRIALRMRRRSDQRGFSIVGYVQVCGAPVLVDAGSVAVFPPQDNLLAFASGHAVDEIVVAVDERRRDGGGQGFPLHQLLDCRLGGIQVVDLLTFVEREVGRIDLDLLHPGWMVYSNGFALSRSRELGKRTLDLVVALLLVIVTSPVMLLAAVAIRLDEGLRAPILYRQERVGLNGALFTVIKFRTMSVDAERHGAVWAQRNDPRVTRVGRFLRQSRIDELPQLINVLRGDMSFVGPRPERPEFVSRLSAELPYYAERHRMKPGLTGWAQVCYPYGASDEDARRKLEYDLYYFKNHSMLFDILIVLQTVEVVLLGAGAR